MTPEQLLHHIDRWLVAGMEGLVNRWAMRATIPVPMEPETLARLQATAKALGERVRSLER